MPHAHTNHLIDSTSPYLLQHAHNPVDWFPWSGEALARSRKENKPIFLSIGYSACHWCHVMEREVFENPDIAAIMNEHFINIKVDREERPDLDDLYMLATQVMSGSGGWPMSVWLTPDLEPFYAGTYFPPVDGYGRPGFPKLELALANAWKTREADMRAQAQRVVEAIKIHADESAGHAAAITEIPAHAWLNSAISQNADRFDDAHGGFGHAPKFPPHATLMLFVQFLLNPPPNTSGETLQQVRTMLSATLDAMARGGIFDHVAGAFARYSTDEKWLVPHFEKMLYDNAQLAPVYALASQVLANPAYAKTARLTLDFWLREMTASTPDSAAFHSTLDADSEGEEGKFYVWTVEDVYTALGHGSDAELICERFGINAAGNWHETPVPGGCVLSEVAPLEELASRFTMDPVSLEARIDQLLLKMRAFRANRVPPGLDDKILTSWSGLMISALATCGTALSEPAYLDVARRAVNFLFTHHVDGTGQLQRTSRKGYAHTRAFLEDHAYLLQGLLDLHAATHDFSFLTRASELGDTLLRDFEDHARGGFFFTSNHHEKLFARMKNAADNATPSANGVAIRALLRLAAISGNSAYRDAALRAIAAFAPHIQRNPSYFPTLLTGLVEHPETISHSHTAPAQSPTAHILSIAPVAPITASPGQTLTIPLLVSIADGYHIQTHAPQDKSAIATILRINSPLARDVKIQYPQPLEIQQNGHTITAYVGHDQFLATFRIAPDTKLGSHRVRAVLEAQPCTATACLPQQVVGIDIHITVAE